MNDKAGDSERGSIYAGDGHTDWHEGRFRLSRLRSVFFIPHTHPPRRVALVREQTILVGAKTKSVPCAVSCTLVASDFSRTSLPHDSTSSKSLNLRCRFLPVMEGLREGGRISSAEPTYPKTHVPTTPERRRK